MSSEGQLKSQLIVESRNRMFNVATLGRERQNSLVTLPKFICGSSDRRLDLDRGPEADSVSSPGHGVVPPITDPSLSPLQSLSLSFF